MTDERGLSGGIQLTLLFPLAFGILLLGLQWALSSWAEATALAAAQDGARAVAGFGGDASSARQAAHTATQNGSLSDVTVEVELSQTRVVVVVEGRPMSVVPGFTPTVTRSAHAPVERITSS